MGEGRESRGRLLFFLRNSESLLRCWTFPASCQACRLLASRPGTVWDLPVLSDHTHTRSQLLSNTLGTTSKAIWAPPPNSAIQSLVLPFGNSLHKASYRRKSCAYTTDSSMQPWRKSHQWVAGIGLLKHDHRMGANFSSSFATQLTMEMQTELYQQINK